MRHGTPVVSIGLPVYNGARFLEAALGSILAQTYQNFELIISDNASTDRTWEICQRVARSDPRVRVVRNARNLGIARNYNRVFELGRGRYFKWSSHDDLAAPRLLERCVEALDRDPGAVLAYPRAVMIDDGGRPLGPRPFPFNTSLQWAYARFGQLVPCNFSSPAVYGVIRTDVLRRTGLHGTYDASDLVFLAELALHGRFHEVPENLLLHREHVGRSAVANRTPEARARLFDPDSDGRIIFPAWRVLFGYLHAVRRAPISWAERGRCLYHVGRWVKWNRRKLVHELRGLVGVRTPLRYPTDAGESEGAEVVGRA